MQGWTGEKAFRRMEDQLEGRATPGQLMISDRPHSHFLTPEVSEPVLHPATSSLFPPTPSPKPVTGAEEHLASLLFRYFNLEDSNTQNLKTNQPFEKNGHHCSVLYRFQINKLYCFGLVASSEGEICQLDQECTGKLCLM